MSPAHAANAPLILFAHGAGAPSSSKWMTEWAARLAGFGPVVSFDYPYMKNGRKAPDKLPVLIEAHAQALAEARRAHGAGRPVVLAGKSMGSRVGCHLANTPEGADVAALMCFGYPLRAAGSGNLRDEVLRALAAPILFLSGSKDPLCPLADLERVRGEMRAPNQLHVVEGGDHSLTVRKRAAATPGAPGPQAASDEAVLAAIATFLRGRGLLS